MAEAGHQSSEQGLVVTSLATVWCFKKNLQGWLDCFAIFLFLTIQALILIILTVLQLTPIPYFPNP